MTTLTILVASRDAKPPGGLHYLPPHRVVYSAMEPWGAAANELLDVAAARGGDALFCDDDVTFTPDSLAHIDPTQADAFGLDLHTLDGQRQIGARHIWEGAYGLRDWVAPGPAYVAHVSTSAIYLTARAIQSAARFPEWPGLHFEDVAYCFDLWRHGCRILAVPGRVDHNLSGGAGATKRHDPLFWTRWQQNLALFRQWCEITDLTCVPGLALPLAVMQEVRG